MALACMDDSQIYRLWLGGAVNWEKYKFDVGEKCGVLRVGSTLISEKEAICNCYDPVFYVVVWGNLQIFWWLSKNLY
jgi:hypothetical protein